MKTAKHSLYFYHANRLIAVKQGSDHRAVFRTVAVPLAEQRSVRLGTSLLAVEGSGTVLQADCAGQREPHNYTAYGYDPTLPSSLTLLGFNGETLIALHVDYALGQGHRCFNPVRMRFNTPDSLSPFSAGLNPYCYCEDDPVNHIDPSGKMKAVWKRPSGRSRIHTVNRSTSPPPKPTSTQSNSAASNKGVSALLSTSSEPAEQTVSRSGTSSPSPQPRPISGSRGSNVDTQSDPGAVVTPTEPSQSARHYRQQPDSPVSSTNSSRDSTPAGSRASSPSLVKMPEFVETSMNIRQSDYYSYRFDPI